MTKVEINEINKYMEMVKELKAYGIATTNNDELWDENYDAMEEIECMTEHCDACLAILERALKKASK